MNMHRVSGCLNHRGVRLSRVASQIFIATAVRSNSVQDSHMRLARGVPAVACLLAGLGLMLRALGLLAVVLHGAGLWWPAFLLAAGVAILLRFVKPGPHIAVSAGLMGAGCIAFAVTRGIITERVWILVAAAGLISAGLILARLAASARPDGANGRTERISVLFRAARLPLKSADAEQVKIFLLCGHLELDLKDAIPPGQRRDAPLMIEITAWAGNVKLLVWEGVEVLNHKAFVLQFRHPIQMGVLNEERTRTAQMVATTLAFFGDVESKEVPLDADFGAPGNLPGPENRRPATR
jgi:hypothetical protein